MSQFMPEGYAEQKEQSKAPEQGPEAYLSPDERKALQRSLSFPEDLPPKFRSWLIDFIAVNIPQIPVSQLVGFTQIDQVEVTSAEVSTSESTTSGSFTDLTTTGPMISALRDGLYVILFGAAIHNTGGGGNGAEVSISVNGAAASGTDQVSNYGITNPLSVSRAVFKTLSSGTNSLQLKYKIANGGTAVFEKRWLIAQRIGPVPS